MDSNVHLFHEQLLEQAKAKAAVHLDLPLAQLHHHPDHHGHVRNLFQQLGQDLVASTAVTVNVNCQFYDSKNQPGPSQTGMAPDDATITFAASQWTRFQGNLTGMWTGAANHDYIFLSHNHTDNTLTAALDSYINTPSAPWTYGSGVFDPSSMSVAVTFTNMGLLTGDVSADYATITGGGFAHWQKWASQAVPSNIHTVHLVGWMGT
jgi:hypothetical protein